jgi:general stress protein YciG
MTDLYKEAWKTWAIDKYGSLEEAKRIRSEAGKKARGVSKRTAFAENPELAREAGKKGGKAKWSKSE